MVHAAGGKEPVTWTYIIGSYATEVKNWTPPCSGAGEGSAGANRCCEGLQKCSDGICRTDCCAHIIAAAGCDEIENADGCVTQVKLDCGNWGICTGNACQSCQTNYIPNANKTACVCGISSCPTGQYKSDCSCLACPDTKSSLTCPVANGTDFRGCPKYWEKTCSDGYQLTEKCVCEKITCSPACPTGQHCDMGVCLCDNTGNAPDPDLGCDEDTGVRCQKNESAIRDTSSSTKQYYCCPNGVKAVAEHTGGLKKSHSVPQCCEIGEIRVTDAGWTRCCPKGSHASAYFEDDAGVSRYECCTGTQVKMKGLYSSHGRCCDPSAGGVGLRPGSDPEKYDRIGCCASTEKQIRSKESWADYCCPADSAGYSITQGRCCATGEIYDVTLDTCCPDDGSSNCSGCGTDGYDTILKRCCKNKERFFNAGVRRWIGVCCPTDSVGYASGKCCSGGEKICANSNCTLKGYYSTWARCCPADAPGEGYSPGKGYGSERCCTTDETVVDDVCCPRGSSAAGRGADGKWTCCTAGEFRLDGYCCPVGSTGYSKESNTCCTADEQLISDRGRVRTDSYPWSVCCPKGTLSCYSEGKWGGLRCVQSGEKALRKDNEADGQFYCCPIGSTGYSSVSGRCCTADERLIVNVGCMKTTDVSCPDADKPLWNPETEECESCPENTVWNDKTKACQSSDTK